MISLIKNMVVRGFNETGKGKKIGYNILIYIVDHIDEVKLFKPNSRQHGNIPWRGHKPILFIWNIRNFSDHTYRNLVIVNKIYIEINNNNRYLPLGYESGLVANRNI